MYLLYQAALALGSLFLFPYWLVRSLAAPEIRGHLSERFGSAPASTGACGPIWIHAASVGEVRIAALLAARLREGSGGRRIVLSVTTPSGRQVARPLLEGRIDELFYVPFDFGFAVRRALRRLRPSIFVAVETEIWPGLFRACRRRGIPHGIVNGRISRRSFGRYRAIRPLVAAALAGVDFLCVQGGEEAERFRRLGARAGPIRITGNMKYDYRPDPVARDRLRGEFGPFAEGWLWLAGSTRSGEEQIVLEAFRTARRHHGDLRLVLAPRQPDRFREVEALSVGSGFRTARRGDLPPPGAAPPEVLVLDSLGELTHLYGIAACAFVGGSLVPRGGHNPIEPAAWGVPVLFGPHMENFRQIAADLVEAGGAYRIAGGKDLAVRVGQLRGDAQLHRRAAEAARRCAERHRGALEETARTIESAVATGGGSAPPARLHAPVLLPLSWPYALLVRLRNRRFERSPGRARRAGIPVVSVGNLVVGGTGKTPVTMTLARRLREAGWSPAIVSRGYRRGGGGEIESARYDGAGPSPRADRLGDEPALMARRLPCTPVVVCADRMRAVRHAVREYGTDLAILDDGFQHRQLHRDLDLLLIDSLDPFGNGRLLPAGPLREPRGAIGRADAVLLTRWDLCADRDALLDAVRRWAGPDTPLFPFRQRIVGVRSSLDAPATPLDRISGAPALAFAGIGNPASFAAELRRLPVRPVATLWFRDHHPYSAADRDRIERVAERAGAEVLLTTEKDRIRFPAESCRLTLYSLEMVLEPIEPEEFGRFLRRRLPAAPAGAGGPR